MAQFGMVLFAAAPLKVNNNKVIRKIEICKSGFNLRILKNPPMTICAIILTKVERNVENYNDDNYEDENIDDN